MVDDEAEVVDQVAEPKHASAKPQTGRAQGWQAKELSRGDQDGGVAMSGDLVVLLLLLPYELDIRFLSVRVWVVCKRAR